MTITKIATLGTSLQPQATAQGTATSSELTAAMVASMIAQTVASEATARQAAIVTAIATEDAAVQTAIAAAIAELGGTTLRSYLAGLITSWAGATSFSVAPGMAMADDQSQMIALASTITKTTSAWVVGENQGGLDTGAVAPSTWYYVWLIERSDTSVVDALYSLSATAPTLPTDYDLKRRIGALKTNASSQFIKYFQYNDRFIWDVPAMEQRATQITNTTAHLYTVTVPPTIKPRAILQIGLDADETQSNISYVLITSPDQTDTTPSSTAYTMVANDYSGAARAPMAAWQAEIEVSTAAQIRVRLSVANVILYLTTRGWDDTRGKDV